ncbi:LysR family transcriptional regulator [Natronincola ferrireducens]|uniref:DNA-binding transcriptional regulator, LysR family n=1 Tax=Natronincola ferrireducens TaxID=393762 RepID=A0A1G9DA45_9FIRM|nr:LysR family transcriptional regulator [Natronincola ferrireducens]SDK60751.1 DNA-binding transcriptional regulator, LysR family [Natronincola ferrireducens]
MDFRKLSYYEAVCRLGSFTKASKELHVTQPSVTMAIQNLEENLNTQLIKRDRDGLLLTPEGEVLYKKAQYILNALQEVTNEIHDLATTKNIILKIGYSIQMRSALFSIVNKFRSMNTHIKIISNESSTPSILRQIEDGMLDLGIVVLTKEIKKRWQTYPLFEGEVCVCVNKENPLSNHEYILLKEFEKQPLISLSLNNPKDSFIFNVLQDAYEDCIISINPKFTALQLESYFEHIANSDGIGLTYYDSWFNCNQYHVGFEGKLPYVMIPFNPACTYTVGIISHKNQKLSKDAKEFIQYVKKQL